MDGIKGYISIREASCRWGVSERRVNQYCAKGRIPGASRFGGEHHAKTEMEPEYHLNIRTAAGKSGAHLPLRHDYRCCAHGLRKDYGGELVSGRARQSRGVKCHTHQRIFR